MFVTDDDELYEQVLTLSNHGRSRVQTKQFWPDMVGFKYKLSNLQAAIGCAQLERLDDLTSRRREVYGYYSEAVLAHPSVAMNPEKARTTNGYWMPTVVFPQDSHLTREKCQTAFSEENIDARAFFWPLSVTGLFGQQERNRLSDDISGRAINLPSYHDMTADDQDRVISVVERLMEDVSYA